MAFVSDAQRRWFFANYGESMSGTVTGQVMRMDNPSVTPRMLREMTDAYAAMKGLQGADRGQLQAGTEGDIRHFRQVGLPRNFSLERFHAGLVEQHAAIERSNQAGALAFDAGQVGRLESASLNEARLAAAIDAARTDAFNTDQFNKRNGGA